MSNAQSRQSDPDATLDRRVEGQSQSAASNAALQEALEEAGVTERQLIEYLMDLDVDSKAIPELEEELGAELSTLFAFANETEADYRRHRWLNENKADRVVSEKDPGRIAAANPAFLELAHGTHRRPETWAPRPQIEHERRQTRTAIAEVRTAMNSLAKDGKLLDAITQITAVTEHRRDQSPGGSDESSSGIRGTLRRVFS